MATQEESSATQSQERLRPSWRTLLKLDVWFRIGIGLGFAYMIYAALQMPETSFGKPAAYPMFVGVIGLTLWAASNGHTLYMALRGRAQGRIYDIAFDTSDVSPRLVWLRTFWVFGILGGLLLGVFVLSFHVTIPLFLLLYLRFAGKASWRLAIITALALEIPLVVLYGAIIHTVWPESLIEQLFDVSFQSILEAPIVRFL